MIQWLVPPAPRDSLYPDSDGKPMADNTTQYRWMVVLEGNLSAQFRDRADVFVAADLFWYAEEGNPTERQAPDVMVVFGRPKGDRGSYKQWEEGGIAPQVVFEILSPSNTRKEMARKRAFYEERGVQEYYVFNPDKNTLEVYLRQGEVFRRKRFAKQWTSPLLGIRFDLTQKPMVVYGADGLRFLPFEELMALKQQAEQERNQAQQERDHATKERDQAAQERNRATQERDQATQERDQATQERDQVAQERDQAQQRAARMAELSRKARHAEATQEELQELDDLENQAIEGS